MHACPIDCMGTGKVWVMRGIHADHNDFLYGEVLDRPGEICSTNDIAEGIFDCDRKCVPADEVRRWTGNGYCDVNQYGVNLACRLFNNDGGDCPNW